MKRKNVTMVLTDKCNLNCIYCYEKYKTNRVMKKETAIDIISHELCLASENEEVVFELFGGEPFENFKLITEIYDQLSDSEHKKWEISIITNGTLVHDNVCVWLEQRKDRVKCILSLDGIREVHNYNRSNSFDSIDIPFFLETYDNPIVKMTISNYTIDRLCDSLVFLYNMGFSVNCSLGYGFEWTKEMLIKLDRQLSDFYELAIKESFIDDRSSLLSLPFENIFYSKNTYYRNCDAGEGHIAYDVDGKRYPCHMFLPNGLSEEQLDGVKKISFPELILEKEQIDFQCVGCPIHSVCQSCYANNYRMNGDIYKQDMGICLANRVVFMNRAKYMLNKWNLGQLDLTDNEEYMLICSIQDILEMEGDCL